MNEKSVLVEGFIEIEDSDTGEHLLSTKNAIHPENMSLALANSLASRGVGALYRLALGNGGATVDETGAITYLPPNTVGQNATLYNQTFSKLIDDTIVTNPDPIRNKMQVVHVSGKTYTDILISCLLDYGEPAGQDAFDNGTNLNSIYTFDEIGLLADYGVDSNGDQVTRLVSHAIFNPVQKSLNRRQLIKYTIRIHSVSNMITI